MGVRISIELYKVVACVRPQSCRSRRSEDRALNPITTFLGRNRGERGGGTDKPCSYRCRDLN